MSAWVWPALGFGAILFVTALARHRWRLAALLLAYAGLAILLSVSTVTSVRFIAPLVLLLGGYWASGPFYTAPSPQLEAWLLRLDTRWNIHRLAAATPSSLHAVLELAYLGCYVFMIAASLPALAVSWDAFAVHWMLVLTAELSCYVTLPWLQARPPRDNGDGSHFSASRKNETRPHFLRRLNTDILDRLSVGATTIPSGHVAGPIAASLSAWMIAPEWGPWLMAGALVITAATVLGRYHYAIDAVLGLAAGALPPVIRAFWP